MPVYLMGVLCHGYRTFGFTYLKNIKHGTNIVLECLHQVLVDYKKTRGYIPPVIYLQLDNTWKQNKNKYMLAYAACLVLWGVCRQVIISYLPVGHTHEDVGPFMWAERGGKGKERGKAREGERKRKKEEGNNNIVSCADQLFSRIAEYLKKHDAYDRQGILDSIKHGFNAEQDVLEPVLLNLDRAANISDWIKQYLAPTPNVSQFRQFKLELIEGKVTVCARARCAEDAEFNPWMDLMLKPGYSQVSIQLNNIHVCFITVLGIRDRSNSNRFGRGAMCPTTCSSQLRK
jgi:hypothetical protein